MEKRFLQLLGYEGNLLGVDKSQGVFIILSLCIMLHRKDYSYRRGIKPLKATPWELSLSFFLEEFVNS